MPNDHPDHDHLGSPSSQSSWLTIDQLPDLCLLGIFRHIPFGELFRIARTCRKFRAIQAEIFARQPAIRFCFFDPNRRRLRMKPFVRIDDRIEHQMDLGDGGDMRKKRNSENEIETNGESWISWQTIQFAEISNRRCARNRHKHRQEQDDNNNNNNNNNDLRTKFTDILQPCAFLPDDVDRVAKTFKNCRHLELMQLDDHLPERFDVILRILDRMHAQLWSLKLDIDYVGSQNLQQLFDRLGDETRFGSLRHLTLGCNDAISFSRFELRFLSRFERLALDCPQNFICDLASPLNMYVPANRSLRELALTINGLAEELNRLDKSAAAAVTYLVALSPQKFPFYQMSRFQRLRTLSIDIRHYSLPQWTQTLSSLPALQFLRLDNWPSWRPAIPYPPVTESGFTTSTTTATASPIDVDQFIPPLRNVRTLVLLIDSIADHSCLLDHRMAQIFPALANFGVQFRADAYICQRCFLFVPPQQQRLLPRMFQKFSNSESNRNSCISSQQQTQQQQWPPAMMTGSTHDQSTLHAMQRCIDETVAPFARQCANLRTIRIGAIRLLPP